MELQDLVTVALLCVCVWTFIPRHIRVALRSGLEPAVATLADTARDVSHVVAKVITHVAYRGLLGEPVPDTIMVKSEEVDDEYEDVVEPVVNNDNDTGQPVAMRDNAINSELTDNAAFTAQVAQLARLYESGQVTNLAKAIEKGFGCSRSSKEDSTYMQVRRALDKHLVKGPQFRQDDGTTAPATRPVTGRRTAA